MIEVHTMTDAQIDACRENPIPPPPGYCSACPHQKRCVKLMWVKWGRIFGLAPKRDYPIVVVIFRLAGK